MLVVPMITGLFTAGIVGVVYDELWKAGSNVVDNCYDLLPE